jgi:hypothetical protein
MVVTGVAAKYAASKVALWVFIEPVLVFDALSTKNWMSVKRAALTSKFAVVSLKSSFTVPVKSTLLIRVELTPVFRKRIVVVAVSCGISGGTYEEEVPGWEETVGLLSSPQAIRPNALKASAELRIRGVVNLELIVKPFLCNLKVKINKIWAKSTKYLTFYNNTKIKLQSGIFIKWV